MLFCSEPNKKRSKNMQPLKIKPCQFSASLKNVKKMMRCASESHENTERAYYKLFFI